MAASSRSGKQPDAWRSWILVFVIGAVVLIAPQLHAQRVCVHFDVTEAIACRDVTDEEFAAANPDEKLLEIRFLISSLIQFGFDRDLLQYLYIVESPEQRLQIVDCFPKTELASDVSGNVRVEQGAQQSSGIDLKSAGALEAQLGADIRAQVGRQSSSRVQYELLPPMELLAASGTMRRAAAAYFKLKPSPRTSLEGAKEFALVVRVPRQWRADFVHIYCAAYAAPSPGVARPVCGTARFIVPIYLEGDVEAKHAAHQYLKSERHLRAVAEEYHVQIEKRRYPSWGHRIGAWVDLVDPKIPPTWLDEVFAGQADSQSASYRRYLPDEVNAAIERFEKARGELAQLR